jgi:hypothetical protein
LCFVCALNVVRCRYKVNELADGRKGVVKRQEWQGQMVARMTKERGVCCRKSAVEGLPCLSRVLRESKAK